MDLIPAPILKSASRLGAAAQNAWCASVGTASLSLWSREGEIYVTDA